MAVRTFAGWSAGSGRGRRCGRETVGMARAGSRRTMPSPARKCNGERTLARYRARALGRTTSPLKNARRCAGLTCSTQTTPRTARTVRGASDRTGSRESCPGSSRARRTHVARESSTAPGRVIGITREGVTIGTHPRGRATRRRRRPASLPVRRTRRQPPSSARGAGRSHRATPARPRRGPPRRQAVVEPRRREPVPRRRLPGHPRGRRRAASVRSGTTPSR